MTKFEPAKLKLLPAKEQIAEFMANYDMGRKEAKHLYTEMLNDDVYRNDTYQVNITWKSCHGFGKDVEIIHLSIKRIDRAPIHDWRDLQEIKNELVGADREAIELYPAEKRRVDTANQYHLWVFPEGQFIPVGWNTRLVMDHGEANDNSVQRPLQ